MQACKSLFPFANAKIRIARHITTIVRISSVLFIPVFVLYDLFMSTCTLGGTAGFDLNAKPQPR
jgi:hypothetical protein